MASLVDASLAAGAEAFARRDFAAAERAFRAALAAAPDDRNATFNLGKVCEVLGRPGEALALYSRLVRRDAKDRESWVRIGIVSYGIGSYAAACDAFTAALQLRSDDPDTALNFGLCATLAGHTGDAIRLLESAVIAYPERPDLRAALADALRVAGALDVATDVAETALARAPNDIHTLLVTGRIAFDNGEFARAHECFSSAQRLDPNRYEADMNLGVLAHGLGQVEPALAAGRRAAAIAPDAADARFNLAISELLAGDFAAGFAGAESRFRLPTPSFTLAVEFAALGVPRWDGAPLAGRNLLVAFEQGLGDFILWSRLLPRLRERGVRTIVECPAALAPLYRDAAGIDELVVGSFDRTRAAELAAYLPVCSLPYALGVQSNAIPAAVPYLHADPARTAAFRARFKALGRPRSVGLVWAGASTFAHDRFRSVPLADLGVLGACDDIAWVSLQKGNHEDDPAPAGLELLRLGPELEDFAVTAAAVVALDLVVTVDTAVAHLAGALAAPVWTIHGFGHHWLWEVRRTDSPWYPTMRLFRQHAPGKWRELLDDLAAALTSWAANPPG